MGQKIRPFSLRLGIVNDWKSHWFAKKGIFRDLLAEDTIIRTIVNDKIKAASIIKITIDRNLNDCKVLIKVARPGLVIGRGGKGIEDLTKLINKKINELYKEKGIKKKAAVNITIDELRRFEVAAANIAQNIAWDLEKRLPFRRLMKKNIELAMQNKDVQGIKIKLAGRLNGSEIARSEHLSQGKLPLQTLRANIDYSDRTAFTTYGTIGIKVWIYKGEVFEKKVPVRK